MTMLTGDNARTARALAAQAGIADVRAELRPEDKATAIGELSKAGSVAMIGDGINDAAPASAHRHRDGSDRLRCGDRVCGRGLHGS
ncbi:HAD family hydrolase [Microbacterium sp.]|uniref:HAD family hydrolase n=1 Tax=Microbacterium sp. TaxID=51671 RepID=UPI003A904474